MTTPYTVNTHGHARSGEVGRGATVTTPGPPHHTKLDNTADKVMRSAEKSDRSLPADVSYLMDQVVGSTGGLRGEEGQP